MNNLFIKLSLLLIISQSVFSNEFIIYEESEEDSTLNTSISCNEIGTSQEFSSLLNLCEITINSEACENIDKGDLKSCSLGPENSEIDVLELISSCASGIYDSLSELVEFIWDVMKFAWSSATDSEYRDDIKEKADSYMESAKLYLMTEYQKAYDESSDPFRKAEALKKMGSAIADMIVNLVMSAISYEVEEFICLNPAAKSKYACKLVSDLFLPPTAALALIKKGPKALKSFSNVSDSLEDLKKKFSPKNAQNSLDTIELSDISSDVKAIAASDKAIKLTDQISEIDNEVRLLLKKTDPESIEKLKKLNDEAIMLLRKYFKEEGIPTTLKATDGLNPVLELKIDLTQSSDSPLFNKLKRYNDNLGNRELRISMVGLYRLGGEGVFIGGQNRVGLGVNSALKLIRGEPATTLSHEYRHSMFEQARSKGKDSVFYGELSSVDSNAPVSKVAAYSKYMIMEELYNHSTDIYDGIRGKNKISASDLQFIKKKTYNVMAMSESIFTNSNEIENATKSILKASKISKSNPFSIVSKDGSSVSFSINKATGTKNITIEYSGKKYVEPVVSDTQRVAFDRIVEGLQYYNKTGDAKGFTRYSLPQLKSIIADIEEKNIKRNQIAKHQFRAAYKLSQDLETATPEALDIDTIKSSAANIRQGVREYKVTSQN